MFARLMAVDPMNRTGIKIMAYAQQQERQASTRAAVLL